MKRINRAKRRHLRLCNLAAGRDRAGRFLVSGMQYECLRAEPGGAEWLRPFDVDVLCDVLLVRP